MRIRRAAPVSNRHLVRELDRGRVRELLLAVGLVVLLLLPLLAYVWTQMEWIRVGYEVERLRRERIEQARLGERLRIERAFLSSLTRAESEARLRLGLVPATGAVVALGEGGGVPIARAAEAAPPAPGSDPPPRSIR